LGAGVVLSVCDPTQVSVAFHRVQGSGTIHQPLHTIRESHEEETRDGVDDGTKANDPALFQASGVGFGSACPDPDGAGSKVAVLSKTNSNDRADLCFQGGFQEGNSADDNKFYARMNNTMTVGT
jgi:hypothetical protein